MIDRAVNESGDSYIRKKMHCEKCDAANGGGYIQGSSGSGDLNQQLVQSVAAPLIQGLLDWIFSPHQKITAAHHIPIMYIYLPPRAR